MGSDTPGSGLESQSSPRQSDVIGRVEGIGIVFSRPDRRSRVRLVGLESSRLVVVVGCEGSG